LHVGRILHQGVYDTKLGSRGISEERESKIEKDSLTQSRTGNREGAMYFWGRYGEERGYHEVGPSYSCLCNVYCVLRSAPHDSTISLIFTPFFCLHFLTFCLSLFFFIFIWVHLKFVEKPLYYIINIKKCERSKGRQIAIYVLWFIFLLCHGF